MLIEHAPGVGGIAYGRGELSPQSPCWYVCENPNRDLDGFAMWHHRGCDVCSQRMNELVAVAGDHPRVKWLYDRMMAPPPVDARA